MLSQIVEKFDEQLNEQKESLSEICSNFSRKGSFRVAFKEVLILVPYSFI